MRTTHNHYLIKKCLVSLLTIAIPLTNVAFYHLNSNRNVNLKMNGYSDVYYFRGESTGQSVVLNHVDSASNLNQLTNYFDNLDENYPKNKFGTCAFQSASMLLGYYDSFYNDSTVSDSFINKVNLTSQSDYYSTTSPGCDHELFNCHINDFYEYIDSHYNDSLQLNLLKIGKNKGYLQDTTLLHDASFGLTIEEQYNVINQYLINNSLSNYYSLTYDDEPISSFEYNFNSELFTSTANALSGQFFLEISSLVSQGIPVLVGVLYRDSTTPGIEFGLHSMVAYDYDYGTLYFHSGYEEELCVTLSGNYVYVGYVALSPTTYANHTCSSNYTLNNVDICTCHLPMHNHEYLIYSQFNSIFHKKYCYCGNNGGNELHNYIERPNGSHICTKCNYLTNGPVIVNGNHHHDN